MALPAQRKGGQNTATLDSFQQALRLAADRMEAERPLVDERSLRAVAAPLTRALSEFCESLTTSQKISKEEYVSVRGPWLEAWSRDPELMKRRVSRVLVGVSERCHTTRDRLQLMVDIIARSGTKRALRMTQLPRPRVPQNEDYGMFIDREANRALLDWGIMSPDEFLGLWPQLDQTLLTRAAQAVGIRLAKWTGPLREELHRRAARFVRNTMV
jgi:hypothetical protein